MVLYKLRVQRESHNVQESQIRRQCLLHRQRYKMIVYINTTKIFIKGSKCMIELNYQFICYMKWLNYEASWS